VLELATRVIREDRRISGQDMRRRQQPFLSCFPVTWTGVWEIPGDAIAAGVNSTQAATMAAQALTRNDMTGLP
jgi:hypothetical protein